MSLDSEIDSLLESDEVSQIDGLNFKKDNKKQPSSRGLEPDIVRRRRKYDERSKRKARRRHKTREIYRFEKLIDESITSEVEGSFSMEDSSFAEYSSVAEDSSVGSWEKSVDHSSELYSGGSSSSSSSRRKKRTTKKKPPKPKQKKSITAKLKETVRRKPTSRKTTGKKSTDKKYEILPPHTRAEFIKLTKGFIPVPRETWHTLEAGSEIMWMSKGSGRVKDRTAYYWYHKEGKGKRMFFMCGPVATCDLKSPWVKNRKFTLFWDQLKKVFVREDPFTRGLRLAIDSRTIQLSDIAHFLKLKYGDEFDQFLKNRALDRKHNKK